MDSTFTSWYTSLSLATYQLLSQFSQFIPRIIGAILVLIIGAAIAKTLRKLVISLLQKLQVAKGLKNTPVEYFVMNAELGQHIEEVVGSLLYWLVMLIVIHSSVSILGLQPLSEVLSKIIDYLPNILSAVIVLFFGLLLAGVVESLVKAALRTIDGHSGRALGKVASYLVMAIAVLAAVSELGIASEFITILFVGFIAMVSLGMGLAIGLGGQDVVKKVLNRWYDNSIAPLSEPDALEPEAKSAKKKSA
ncbi:MAG: hypothetical protein M3Q81_03095 [bacterium]|nr:hypothetical protein [bacterium]